MKTRHKIAVVIILALLYWAVISSLERDASAGKTSSYGMTVKQLRAKYDENNDRFFDGKLPKNVVIDYKNTDPDSMAATSMTGDVFSISFNPEFSNSPRIDMLVLLHEQCHIRTWAEYSKHGPEWRTCMLAVDAAGGFRELLIDGYKEKTP